jgi:hypothetical protein
VIRFYLPVLAGLIVLSSADAQAPVLKYSWHKGQILVYKVEHDSTFTDAIPEAKVETRTKLNLTKRWEVLDVDDAGVGTLQLTITAMRNEVTPPKGDVMLYDSANPEKSPEEMRKAMAGFLNQPLVVIRVDSAGRVVELKQSKQGGISRFEAMPPFVAVVPRQAVQSGQYWDRAYDITLEPPQGTGEKYSASQRYTCKQSSAKSVVIQLTTTLLKEPEAVADRIPLLQSLPEGEVDFDPENGIMRSAHLKIDKELKGHQGEGSSYHCVTSYT